VSGDLFTYVQLYRRQLTVARHLLDKGAEHARSQGVGEEEMLGWRLIDDMHPLRFQLAVVNNFAQSWPARAAGLEVPPEVPLDLDGQGLRAAFDRSAAFLEILTPEQFEDRADTPITQKLGETMEPTLPADRWLSGFATTNLLFHLSIAYAILRARGVPLGKVDLFAGGL
jgi:uncharacterized protein